MTLTPGIIFYGALCMLVCTGTVYSVINLFRAIKAGDRRWIMTQSAILLLCIAVCIFALGFEMKRGLVIFNFI